MSSRPPRQPAFVWHRWANVALRGLHLIAVVWLGAGLLGAPVTTDTAVATLAASGILMFGLDIWHKPSHLREVSGIAVPLKLILVGWMALDANLRPVLFWLIVAGSAVFAHAPSSFRHAILIGRRA